MILKEFKGYIEGADLTKIPVENLAYPSKNVFVNKGTITTRGGLANDGTVATVAEAVHSEFVWKDALSGNIPIRVHAGSLQIKYSTRWLTIYTGLSATTTRVFFATWVDNNGTIIKKRLFFCDGTTAIYQWNGAIGVVASSTASTATLAAGATALARGFDDGSSTNQTILHFIGSAVTANSEEVQTNNPTGQDLVISGTFNTTPVANDLIIAKPVKFADEISSTYNIDAIFSFQNHIVAASYDSVSVYLSHVSTYSLSTGLDFTMPAAGSRTALTPIRIELDGNFTAMEARPVNNPTTALRNVLWISDADDWYKVIKTTEINAYSLWVDVFKVETGELKGALPMALTIVKGDIIYLAQDKTLQKITTSEITGKDDIQLLSDDVEALLDRLDSDDVRLNYIDRAVYIIYPQEGVLVILDLVEGYFQPPQYLPLNCISVIDGIKYGHHNAENSTYKLFSGRSDLDTPIEAIIAIGLWYGDHPFRYKQHTMLGVNCRLSASTIASVDQFFEENGAKTETNYRIDGGVVKTFGVSDDVSWATHPYADRSWAGADMEVEEVRRAMVFKKFNAVSYFDYSVKITVSGDENEFHLLGLYWDDIPAPRKIGNDLFVDA